MSDISSQLENTSASFTNALFKWVQEVQKEIFNSYFLEENGKIELSNGILMSISQGFNSTGDVDLLHLFQRRLNDWENYEAVKEFYEIVSRRYAVEVIDGAFYDGIGKLQKETITDILCVFVWEYNMTCGFTIDIILQKNGELEINLVEGKILKQVILKLKPIS